MATDKKRVIVYLNESDKRELDSIADDMGCSVSRLCGDVLLQSMPQLKATAEALKVARTDPEKAMEMMKHAAELAQNQLTSEVGKL